jgi:hypothetical protein
VGKREAEVELTLWNVLTSPKARKFQVAVVGILLSAATGGLLPPDVAVWIILIINTLVAYGVFSLPNKPQTLVVAPAGTAPEKVDRVIETPEPVVEAMIRGDVRG